MPAITIPVPASRYGNNTWRQTVNDDSSSTLATDTFCFNSAVFFARGWSTGGKKRSPWLSVIPERWELFLPTGLFPLAQDFLFFFRWCVCWGGLSSSMMAVLDAKKESCWIDVWFGLTSKWGYKTKDRLYNYFNNKNNKTISRWLI